MKRRIASSSTDDLLVAAQSAPRHCGRSVSPEDSGQQKAKRLKGAEDSFSVKGWIEIAPAEHNSLHDMMRDHIPDKKLAANILESLEKGVPYGFAARKEGQRFVVVEHSAAAINDFVAEKKSTPNEEDLFFGAFLEPGSRPLIFGTAEIMKKTGADDDFLNYLLRPQEEKEPYQLRSRALFQSLLDAADIGNHFPFFSRKLQQYSELDDVSFAQEELVIDASMLSSTFFLKTFLELGFPANSFSYETGVWAVNVAARHNREECLKLLSDYGADLNAEETTPYS